MIQFYKNLTPYTVALFASILALCGVVFFQYGLDLAPCYFCVQQRYGWALTAGIALVGIMLDRPYGHNALATNTAVAFMLGGVVWSGYWAFLHMGVQFGWLTMQSACTAPATNATNIADLKQQLFATPVRRCDEIEWSLWGWVTIPVLNFALCLWALSEITTTTNTIKKRILQWLHLTNT